MDASSPELTRRSPSGRTFSLSTLMLLISAFSVWMALLVNFPCLAVGSLVFLIPASARAVEAVRLIHRQGRTPSWGEKLEHFLSSLLMSIVVSIFTIGLMFIVFVVLTMLLGILVALFGDSLTGSGFEMLASGIIIVATGAAGLVFLIFMFWKAWPNENRLSDFARKEYL